MCVVDEVGQFVARDVQKMLDLQAVVQSLGVKGRGKHWIVVKSMIHKLYKNSKTKMSVRLEKQLHKVLDGRMICKKPRERRLCNRKKFQIISKMC